MNTLIHDYIPSTELKEVTIIRKLNAPVDLLFAMWTDPGHVAQWWGSEGFTNTVYEWNARPGGNIHIGMHSTGGHDFLVKGNFVEIEEPNRLVITLCAFADENGEPKLEVLNTIRLRKDIIKTTVILHAKVVKATAKVAGLPAGVEEIWRESFNKLKKLLKPIQLAY